jgi:hypothetical protein
MFTRSLTQAARRMPLRSATFSSIARPAVRPAAQMQMISRNQFKQVQRGMATEAAAAAGVVPYVAMLLILLGLERFFLHRDHHADGLESARDAEGKLEALEKQAEEAARVLAKELEGKAGSVQLADARVRISLIF